MNGHRLVVHDRGHDLTGVVHEGEAWAAAARRTVASLHVDPVPVDLSGEVKHFVVDHDNRVTVRAMTRGDLPDVTRWRQSEHVRRWWASEGEPTPERIEARYGPCIDGMSPTRMWVAEVNGRSVGFVQDYRWGLPGVRRARARPRCRRRRLRARRGVEWPGPRRPGPVGLDVAGAAAVPAGAEPTSRRPTIANAASLRMLAKAGFAEGLWFDEPQEDGSVDTVVGCTLDVARVLG